jgi:DNA-binding PadR family transcriptional regulator
MHPQAVPRGFLRLYILSLLSRGSETGYSIIQAISEKTDGAWSPGAGTVYPLLRSLVRDGLLKRLDFGKGSRKVYSITEKGKLELEERRQIIASAGRRQETIIKLFVDLVPPPAFASMVVTRGRELLDIFREKILEVPEPEREAMLKEMRVIMENQVSWIDSALQIKARPANHRK